MSAPTPGLTLLRLDPRIEPFIWRVVRKRSRFPVSTLALVAAGLAGVTAGTAAALTLLAANEWAVPLYLVFLPFQLLLRLAMFALPIIAVVIAAQITERDVTSGAHELLRLTDLPAQVIFQGYVAATLYLLRVPLAVITGLLPILAITAPFGSIEGYSYGLLNVVFTTLGAALGLWCYTLLGVAISVHACMNKQSAVMAGVIALGSMLAVWITARLVGLVYAVATILIAYGSNFLPSPGTTAFDWLAIIVADAPLYLAVLFELWLRWRLRPA